MSRIRLNPLSALLAALLALVLAFTAEARVVGGTLADLSMLEVRQVTERVRAQFRSEFFNASNHSNFATSNEVVFSSGPTQGRIANRTTAVVASPSAGVITATSTNSRQIQFGLKLLF